MSAGPESAEGESEIVGVCASCGRPLTQLGPHGECLRCLMSLAFLGDSRSPERSAVRSRLTPRALKYDHFEVEVGDDGFPVELGAGAMAITYRARDTVLNSTVALKVIDRKIAENSGARSRFLREARAAAQIHHPNVARVSHYGEQAGECFYVMELVEGETLEQRVRRDGPMPLSLALEVTEQVTRALIAAEKCGVVHRDLKPSNIMLETDASGRVLVKVIDYGVAKVLAPEPNQDLEQTQAGFVGTPAFASPEQFSGGTPRQIDTRSDIYSLGITLWYLLTGSTPFAASSLEELHQKQIGKLPLERLKELHVPARCIELLKWMLAPDPKDRPRSARELLTALDRCCARFTPEARRRRHRLILTRSLLGLGLAGVVAFIWFQQNRRVSGEVERSIAVLPFESLSSNADDAYFAAGLQDEILTNLAKLSDLKVISRTSTAKYKSKPENLKTLAQELGVGTVLEGSVQREADKIRVNVQLIDARSDTHKWASSYDRDTKDLFAAESEISQEIAGQMKAKLSPSEASRLASVPTRDPEAYDLLLRGEYEEQQAASTLKRESFDRAISCYRQALARDPNFAVAAARLAGVQISRHSSIARLSDSELAGTKALAERAIALAPNLAEGHLALGDYYARGKRDNANAAKEFQRALELEPNNAKALEFAAYNYRRHGNWDRALKEMLKCEQRDPRNGVLVAQIAGSYCNLRRWNEAKREASRAVALDPNSLLGARTLVNTALNGSGDIAEAKRLIANSPPNTKISDFTILGNLPTAAYLHVIERDYAGALQLCEGEVADPNENRARMAARVAIHLLAGDTYPDLEKARESIETRLRSQADDAAAMTQLAWVNLALKQNADAIRLARQGSETVPLEKDAISGAVLLAGLAQIQARANDPSGAVKSLQRLLSVPIGYYISIQGLKLDPVWDPIRGDSGFQQLLAGKELIGPNK
jgi:serine/threonine protein kinase